MMEFIFGVVLATLMYGGWELWSRRSPRVRMIRGYRRICPACEMPRMGRIAS